MDTYRQQLAALDQEIKELIKKKTRLQMMDRTGTITAEEKIDLADILELLAEARDSKNNLVELFMLETQKQQLAAVEQEIKDLIDQRAALKKVERKQVLTSDEQDELARLEMRLAEAREQRKDYLKLAIKEPPESKSFSEADSDWIQAVTGVNTTYRKWTGYVIDETVLPGPEFKTAFERVGKAFHQLNEAGRRIFLNLFLSDIILRPEFDEALRIFPELDVTVVETKGPKKRKLSGRTDYTVGFAKGKDIFNNTIPRDVHLVAVQAKTSIGEEDLWQCAAEAASLYKTRVDAGKVNRSVWGILSNAKQWQFLYIDEDGFMWQSDDFLMNLRSYDELQVLQVYRIVHYIVKCCHEACTPPPSTASSVPVSSSLPAVPAISEMAKVQNDMHEAISQLTLQTKKMDTYRQAREQEIKELIKKRSRLQMKVWTGIITAEEKFDLASIDKLLAEGRDNKKTYCNRIMLETQYQQLGALGQEVRELINKKTRLEMEDWHKTISAEGKIDLADIIELLAEARDSENNLVELIMLAMGYEPLLTKSFSEADREWIQAVTGVDTSYRKWT
ncbi:hypothetical protein HDU67_002610, partial [Dinochytrium kinnereticum]